MVLRLLRRFAATGPVTCSFCGPVLCCPRSAGWL